MSDLLNDWFADFFGTGSVAPESVARKVLAIGTTLPLNEAGVRTAFRFRIRQLRPDLTDEAADRLRLRDLREDADGDVDGGEVRFDSGSKQEQLAELLWAREDLLRRIPKPVTGAQVAGVESLAAVTGTHLLRPVRSLRIV